MLVRDKVSLIGNYDTLDVKQEKIPSFGLLRWTAAIGKMNVPRKLLPIELTIVVETFGEVDVITSDRLTGHKGTNIYTLIKWPSAQRRHKIRHSMVTPK